MSDGAAFQRAGLLVAGLVLALYGAAGVRALGPEGTASEAEVLEVTRSASGPGLAEVRVTDALGRGWLRSVVLPRRQLASLRPGDRVTVREDHGRLLLADEALRQRQGRRRRALGWVALGALGWLLALGNALWSRRRVVTLESGSTPRSGDGPGLQNR